MYQALLPRLIDRGYRVAVAQMTLPNDASMGLRAALGFQPVGVHRRIGGKHGAWHDVAIAQLDLVADSSPPTEQNSSYARRSCAAQGPGTSVEPEPGLAPEHPN